jgi:hypothetical protein
MHALEATTHAAEHLRQDIVEIGSSAAAHSAALFESGHAVLIVEVAGLFIAEDFVGLRDGLELFVGFGTLLVGDLVGVGSEGCLEGEC